MSFVQRYIGDVTFIKMERSVGMVYDTSPRRMTDHPVLLQGPSSGDFVEMAVLSCRLDVTSSSKGQ